MDKNCPYCGILFVVEGLHPDRKALSFYRQPSSGIRFASENPNMTTTVIAHLCPSCGREIIWLRKFETIIESSFPVGEDEEYILLYPKEININIPEEIPLEYASIYREAKRILTISPRASAALSRRCLQQLIREQEKIEKKSLYEEIKILIEKNILPVYLSNDLDTIRQIGNFAAHPIKDINTGEIINVEPGEAEWNLEVLFDLLSFYYIESAKSLKRREMLNKKLKSAGKFNN